MSSIVFILGAGASKEAGAPVMKDFLSVARRIWREGRASEIAGDFDIVWDVMSQLQVVHSKAKLDIQNIEEIFSLLDMGETLAKFPSLSNTTPREAMASLKRVIAATLELSLRFEGNINQIEPPRPYHDFAGLVRQLDQMRNKGFSVSILTFNYDIGMDYALHHLDVPFNYGFDDKRNGIPLLKLHGSLNWASSNDSDEIIPLSFGSIHPLARYVSTGANSGGSGLYLRFTNRFHELLAPAVQGEFTPVIVPPTWNKSEHQRKISRVWARAAQELTDAQYVFIIGYSWPETDTFFRYLYSLGTIGKNPLEAIRVYNPDNDLRVRFASMQGAGSTTRFEFETLTFSRTFDRIANLFRDYL